MKKFYVLGFLFSLMVPFILLAQNQVISDPANGDWTEQNVILFNTPEAEVMIRTGDIDNLGFGWPSGFDPFTGNTTPAHTYPWTATAADANGTDRIMVISSYVGTPPHGEDGYTSTTTRPENLPRPIVLDYSLAGMTVTNAVLQIFVDDFQAPVWQAHYFVTLNGVFAPYIEMLVNDLTQTGPVGKLITVNIPEEHLSLLESDSLSILFDDHTTGAGDGYAIDFVKLLINTTGYSYTGSLYGKVTEVGTGTPLEDAVVFTPATSQVMTNASGDYTMTNIPAGLTRVSATKFGYDTAFTWVDLQSGQNLQRDFQVMKILDAEFTAEPRSGTIPLVVQFTDMTTMNPNQWTWDYGDNSGIYSYNIKNPQHTFHTMTGVFTVSLTASNGIQTNTETKVGYITVYGVGIDEPEIVNGFTIGPNPVTTQLMVSYRLTANVRMEAGLFTPAGQNVKGIRASSQSPGEHSFLLNCNDLSSGLYFLEVAFDGRRILRKVQVVR